MHWRTTLAGIFAGLGQAIVLIGTSSNKPTLTTTGHALTAIATAVLGAQAADAKGTHNGKG